MRVPQLMILFLYIYMTETSKQVSLSALKNFETSNRFPLAELAAGGVSPHCLVFRSCFSFTPQTRFPDSQHETSVIKGKLKCAYLSQGVLSNIKGLRVPLLPSSVREAAVE